MEGNGFRDRIREFEAKNIVILGASFDAPGDNKKFCDKFSYPFKLLSFPHDLGKTTRRRDKVMDEQQEDRLWSVQDVSDYLGVPVQTIYGWRSAGTGPPGRRLGKRLRYRPQDVRDWVAGLPTGVAS